MIEKEMTAPNVSVGADTEQSIQKCTDNSINDNNENFKGDCGGNLGPNPSYATRPKSLRYCMGLL